MLGEVCESMRVWVGSLCRVCAHTHRQREKLREKESERGRRRGRQSACLLINTIKNLNQFQTQQVTAVNKGDNEHASPLVMAAMSSPWRQDMPTRNGT